MSAALRVENPQIFRWKMPFAVFRSGSGVSEKLVLSPNAAGALVGSSAPARGHLEQPGGGPVFFTMSFFRSAARLFRGMRLFYLQLRSFYLQWGNHKQ